MCVCVSVRVGLCLAGNSITLKMRFKKGTNPIGIFEFECVCVWDYMKQIIAVDVGVAQPVSLPGIA